MALRNHLGYLSHQHSSGRSRHLLLLLQAARYHRYAGSRQVSLWLGGEKHIPKSPADWSLVDSFSKVTETQTIPRINQFSPPDSMRLARAAHNLPSREGARGYQAPSSLPLRHGTCLLQVPRSVVSSTDNTGDRKNGLKELPNQVGTLLFGGWAH